MRRSRGGRGLISVSLGMRPASPTCWAPTGLGNFFRPMHSSAEPPACAKICCRRGHTSVPQWWVEGNCDKDVRLANAAAFKAPVSGWTGGAEHSLISASSQRRHQAALPRRAQALFQLGMRLARPRRGRPPGPHAGSGGRGESPASRRGYARDGADSGQTSAARGAWKRPGP